MKHVRHLALPAGQRRAHDGQGPVRLQEARLWYLHVNARLRSALAGAVAQKARIYEPLGVPYLPQLLRIYEVFELRHSQCLIYTNHWECRSSVSTGAQPRCVAAIPAGCRPGDVALRIASKSPRVLGPLLCAAESLPSRWHTNSTLGDRGTKQQNQLVSANRPHAARLYRNQYVYYIYIEIRVCPWLGAA